ncbi:MAG: hypothetical protein GEU78_18515 [Actinobacteria bacterium]|nr:hypothetical protein [Actinomycetota bacterium]
MEPTIPEEVVERLKATFLKPDKRFTADLSDTDFGDLLREIFTIALGPEFAVVPVSALRHSASEATAAERKRCAELAREFSWILPLDDDPMLNEFSDDVACEIQEQIATAIDKEPGCD